MNSTIEQTTEFSTNLKRTYDWFSNTFSTIVVGACQEFFGVEDANIRLFAISENNNIFLKGSKYFVTRAKITKELDVAIRISQELVSHFLDTSLGTPKKRFAIEKISELEANLITAFNDYLSKIILKKLTKKEEIDKKAHLISLCHLVFCISFDNGDFGKLIVTIPTNIIKPTEVEQPEEETFSLHYFRKSSTYLRIKVGTSKLTLGDVKSIRKEDILLLENSNIYSMAICNGDEEIEFKLNPDPSIIIDTDDEENSMSDVPVSATNMWDSIQVDISAEFEKVKISLGELRQISEGLVVDIGSIYENKVDLKVENKIVARGELVILNDRYGVRIDEVVQEEDEPDIEEEEETSEVSEDEDDDFEDEDFDYDDFEEDNEI